MTPPDDNHEDLAELFGRFVDQRIEPDELKRLEDRLRSDVAAREYCADRLRFESELKEALDPREIEWLETRRVVLARGGDPNAWAVERSQSLRFGSAAAPPVLVRARRARRPWVVAGLFGLLVVSVAAWLLLRPASEPPVLILKNADFEATDLTFSSSGITLALVDWQDYFQSDGASLREIGRTSRGAIFAKSGRNVARLQPGAFLTQRLAFDDGQPLTAHSGLRVIITGWAYADGEAPPLLRGALRVVASAHPDMIQYEAANAETPPLEPGWQRFRLELALAETLEHLPSDIFPRRDEPPRLDLTGRELTLSLDSRGGKESILFLDDLEIELFQAGTR